MQTQTRSQKMAAEAAKKVAGRGKDDEYRSFAREFPTLVHTCGLAQAVAFAQAKKGHHQQYLDDLAAVLAAAGYPVSTGAGLSDYLRAQATMAVEYLRISRDAIDAAVWLKRFAEAAKAAQEVTT